MRWFQDNRRSFPWRKKGLTSYEIFTAEMLLRKTTAEAVERVYDDFVSRFPTLQSINRAEVEEIAEFLQSLGLQNKRAQAFKDIAELCQDGIPDSREELMELPHVGPYISDSTLCFGFDSRQPIIDANVARIYSRLLGKYFGSGHQMYRNKELREIVQADLPQDLYKDFNWALLDFGAIMCTARSPRCERCFANEYCSYYQREKNN